MILILLMNLWASGFLKLQMKSTPIDAIHAIIPFKKIVPSKLDI